MRYGFRDTVDEALDYIGYGWYIDEIHNGDLESKDRLKDHMVRGVNSYTVWKKLDASDVESCMKHWKILKSVMMRYKEKKRIDSPSFFLCRHNEFMLQS